MGPLRHVKPVVRGLSAYTLQARPAAVKLDQNENPFDLPEDFKRAVVERALARDWARYPEFDPKELCEALARHWGWRADGVLAGNGSNELIEALLVVTVGESTPVVVPEPTFTLYGLLTQMLGGRLVRVPLGPGLEYDAGGDRARAARARGAGDDRVFLTRRAARSRFRGCRGGCATRADNWSCSTRPPRVLRPGRRAAARRATGTWSCCAFSQRPARWPGGCGWALLASPEALVRG